MPKLCFPIACFDAVLTICLDPLFFFSTHEVVPESPQAGASNFFPSYLMALPLYCGDRMPVISDGCLFFFVLRVAPRFFYLGDSESGRAVCTLPNLSPTLPSSALVSSFWRRAFSASDVFLVASFGSRAGSRRGFRAYPCLRPSFCVLSSLYLLSRSPFFPSDCCCNPPPKGV